MPSATAPVGRVCSERVVEYVNDMPVGCCFMTVLVARISCDRACRPCLLLAVHVCQACLALGLGCAPIFFLMGFIITFLWLLPILVTASGRCVF